MTSGITYPVVPDVFRACGEQSEARFIYNIGKSTQNLILDGYIVDRILHAYPQPRSSTFTTLASQRHRILSDSRLQHLVTKSLGPGETPVSAYWMTVCANQTKLGELIIPSADASGDRNRIPTDEAQESSWTPEDSPPMALQFSENRRFFVSAGGRLGLAPSIADEGDHVVVCPGGKVPYILRRTEDGNYILLGDSYVHGIMDGEAIRTHDTRIQTFTVV